MIDSREAPRTIVEEGPPFADAFQSREFFAVLDRLSIEPSHSLDYIYRHNQMVGRPILYVRPEESPSAPSYRVLELSKLALRQSATEDIASFACRN